MSISPALAVTAVTQTNLSRTAVLTTATQANATAYTVTVSGITGMRGSAQVRFVGTYLGPNDAKTTFEDDFNRASGFVLTDTPIPGPWTNLNLTVGNTVELRPAPTATPAVPWSGTDSLYSRDTPLDPDNDNADVQARVSGKRHLLLGLHLRPAPDLAGGHRSRPAAPRTTSRTPRTRASTPSPSRPRRTRWCQLEEPDRRLQRGGLDGRHRRQLQPVALAADARQRTARRVPVRCRCSSTASSCSRTRRSASTGAIKMIYAEAGIMHMTPARRPRPTPTSCGWGPPTRCRR